MIGRLFFGELLLQLGRVVSAVAVLDLRFEVADFIRVAFAGFRPAVGCFLSVQRIKLFLDRCGRGIGGVLRYLNLVGINVVDGIFRFGFPVLQLTQLLIDVSLLCLLFLIVFFLEVAFDLIRKAVYIGSKVFAVLNFLVQLVLRRLSDPLYFRDFLIGLPFPQRYFPAESLPFLVVLGLYGGALLRRCVLQSLCFLRVQRLRPGINLPKCFRKVGLNLLNVLGNQLRSRFGGVGRFGAVLADRVSKKLHKVEAVSICVGQRADIRNRKMQIVPDILGYIPDRCFDVVGGGFDSVGDPVNQVFAPLNSLTWQALNPINCCSNSSFYSSNHIVNRAVHSVLH